MRDRPINFWMLVSSAENFETSRKLGFTLAGMKSRHRKKAEKVQPGDRVLFYLTGVQRFGGTATVTSPYFEDSQPVWVSKKDGEGYPFRFQIKPDLILEPDQFVKAEALLDDLQWITKWPREHWQLAFQGNVHLLPEADFRRIEQALSEAKERMPVAAR